MPWQKGRKRKKLPDRCTLKVFKWLFLQHIQQIKAAKSLKGVQPVPLKQMAEQFCYASPLTAGRYQFLKSGADLPEGKENHYYEYHRFCTEIGRMVKNGVLIRPQHGQFQIEPKILFPVVKKCKGNIKIIPKSFFDILLEKADL